ncbi:tripartite tricarboxylate transporter permease [Serinicoccus kebangsaanensis]|uniref:tripartite tricarboxylate transporter permease n=1 Tax=Serinicoccus kebangsaanensis TaxID=2602069 RepID=UPI00124F763E|nr:tripartite tricarboxylate transporter permease [Serinicoccus kebangsaanensis]
MTVLAASGGSLYTEGWSLVATPTTLLLILVSVLVGMVVGAIPGLTANMSVAVLVPLTFTMSPTEAIAVLTGVWLGAMYGGTLPAILINMPGTPADLMSTIDGYPMSRRGEGGRAIGIGVLSSFLGGVFSVLVLGSAGPVLASFASNFGSAEYFAVALLGLSVIAFVSGSSMLKGIISALLGLLVGSIGRDVMTGQSRLTLDQQELYGGVDFIAVVVGIFGLSEVIEQVYARQHRLSERPQEVRRVWSAVKDVLPLRWVIARSSVIGTLVGAIPGAGPTIASVISYGTQKQLSKHPEKMGKGAPEGLSASDTANNAATGGSLLTTLSLGIPGDALTAILLGALIIQGVQPGPLLFENESALVSSIFISLLLANVCLLLIGMLGARHFAKVLNVPRTLLYPLIVVACIAGAYALNGSAFDVGVTLVAALVGFLFSRAGIPKAPLVLALILGPILESNLRRLLSLNDGDVLASAGTLATSPVGLPVLVVTAALFILPMVNAARERRRARAETDDESRRTRTRAREEH